MAPATVSSIYLTSAFLRDELSAKASAEAKLAAQRLRRWAIATVLVAVVLFVLTLMLLIHVDRGRREIQQLARVQNEYQLVVSAIDQAHDPNLFTDCKNGLSLPNSSDGRVNTNYQPLCERLRGALHGIQIVRTGLRAWNVVSYRLAYLMPIRWLAFTTFCRKVCRSRNGKRVSCAPPQSWPVLPVCSAYVPRPPRCLHICLPGSRPAGAIGDPAARRRLSRYTADAVGHDPRWPPGVVWTTGQPITLEGVTLSLAALAFFRWIRRRWSFIMDAIVIKAAGALGK